ncbi:mediator-associated protein 1 [Phtheirospermum japonicum]|uniref:Mediator-associated protein 1 n=1 Tax=Phtheirospermum japonicum TaxID=374723 RepID=A0A830C461_9LAMI|nr:mediator-associated protein 1 [Phtheirospermum japonicum]
MAKNREPEKSVESDSESGEEEDSSSGSEPEPEPTEVTRKPSSTTPAAAKKPQSQSASKPQQPPSSSLPDEEESGSESDSDSDPKPRSIAAKPKDDPQKSTNGARKSRSKSSAADPVTPTKSGAVKRPAEEKETEAKDAKKSKKKAEPEKKATDDPKKALFQRLWSEEDEIVILKGMIDYSAKKKSDPVADLNAFHDFIKKNLHIDVTKTQLQDKIRRLKKKYENNKSREKKDGKERTFPKPHEQKAYELSKSVWGRNENVKEDKDNEEPKDANKSVDAKRVKSIGATVEERILMIGAEMFEDEGGNEWNKLKMEEMELYLRHLEVKTAQARVVIERLKSQGK